MVPDPPVTINLGGGSGPWPAFTVSGITGAGYLVMNGAYTLDYDEGDPIWIRAGFGTDGLLISGTPGNWMFFLEDAQFSGDGEWPWTSTWTPVDNAGGTPAFVRALGRPVTVDL